MSNLEYTRQWHSNVLAKPDYLMALRASWMTHEQWRQLDAYRQGREIPTDPEIVEGLRYCSEQHATHRSAAWMHASVASVLVNEPNFTYWCQCIRELCDPDLHMDEGL